MGLFDRFKKKPRQDIAREPEIAAAEPAIEFTTDAFPPEDEYDLSLSVDFTMTKNSVVEGMTMTAASLDDAKSHRQDSISNERIESGDVMLDTYEVESDAISGGMGSVWRVRHRSWDAELAMKRPHPRFFAEAGPERKAAFVAECENWINLGLHPNIVSCYYVREVGGVPTVFSEWMAGGSLKDAIASGALYEGDADVVQQRILDVAIQAARGLAYSHERELFHQDVKPANILLTPEWDAKVADFGLAQAVSRAAAGSEARPTGYTLAYCPAAQVAGEKPAAWMDVYAWALTVLEMYAGGRSWERGADVPDALADIYEGCRCAVPLDLEDLIERCLTMHLGDFGAIEQALVECYGDVVGSSYRRDASKAASDVADALNNRALSMLDLNKPEEAERLWAQAREADPSHLASAYNQALFKWRNGWIDDREAVRSVEAIAHPRAPELVQRLRRDVGGVGNLFAQFDCRSESELLSEEARLEADSHGFLVYVAACPNEEQILVASSSDAWMRIVDAASGRWLVDFDMRLHPDNAFLAQPMCDGEGRIVVSAGAERRVYVWDMRSGECLHAMEGHENWVRAVAVDKGGRTILSGDTDGKLKQWDAESGTCVGTYDIYEEVRAIAIDSKAERALIGTSEGNVIVWSIPEAREICMLMEHDCAIEALVFGLDDEHAISCGQNESTVYWDVSHERCLMTLESVADAWKSCGRIPLNRDGALSLWPLEDEGPAEWELSVVQSTEETLAFESAFEQALERARTSLEKMDIPAAIEHIESARSCRGFENDARLRELSDRIDGLCTKESIRAITEVGTVPIRCEGAQFMHITSDERYAIVTSDDELVVWSLDEDRMLATFGQEDLFGERAHIGRLYLSQDGTKAMCASASRGAVCAVLVFSDGECKVTSDSMRAAFGSAYVECPLYMDPSLSSAVYICEEKTYFVDVDTKDKKLLMDFDTSTLALSADGRHVFYVDDDACELVKKPVDADRPEMRFEGSAGSYAMISLDGDEKRVLVLTEDEKLVIMDVETGRVLVMPQYDGEVNEKAVFSSDGRFVFTCDYDDHVFSFYADTGELAFELDGTGGAWMFDLSEDMHTLYTGDRDGFIRVWRIEYDYSYPV